MDWCRPASSSASPSACGAGAGCWAGPLGSRGQGRAVLWFEHLCTSWSSRPSAPRCMPSPLHLTCWSPPLAPAPPPRGRRYDPTKQYLQLSMDANFKSSAAQAVVRDQFSVMGGAARGPWGQTGHGHSMCCPTRCHPPTAGKHTLQRTHTRSAAHTTSTAAPPQPPRRCACSHQDESPPCCCACPAAAHQDESSTHPPAFAPASQLLIKMKPTLLGPAFSMRLEVSHVQLAARLNLGLQFTKEPPGG